MSTRFNHRSDSVKYLRLGSSRMPRWTALVALLLIPLPFVALAGCTDDCQAGPPVTARGIVSGPSSGGSGDYALDLRIVDGPGGPPVAGAGVVVYWGGDSSSSWSGPRISVTGGAANSPDGQSAGGSVVVDPGTQAETVEAKTTVRILTDADGRARANVPANRIVGIVAAKDGYTEEWVPALATGDAAGAGTLAVPLFRTQLALDMEAVWQGPAQGSTGTVTSSSYAWDPHDVPFGETEEANRAYAARIVEMTVTIAWSNDPMGAGDLGIGTGHEGDGPARFHDGGNNAAPGAQSESVTLSLSDLMEHGILGAPRIRAGAATDSAVVAPFGLPYAMHIEARFDRELAERATSCGTVRGSASDNDGYGANTPGFEAVALVIAGAVGVLLSRRR